MESLQEAIGRITRRVQDWLKNGFKGSEDDTKAALIEPLLAALGWDVHDPREVRRQYRHTSGDNPVDFALFLEAKPVLFIEAKALGQRLDQHRWKNQAVNYADTSGVDWCVLTDGNHWQIYKSNAPGEVEKKLFLETCIRLRGDKTNLWEPHEVLFYLSKSAMREKGLEVLWRAENVFMRTEQSFLHLRISGRGLDHILDQDALLALREQLEGVLDTLTERERDVIKLRFGLEDGYARTLEEVGRVFKVTRERIRQIEVKALKKLKHPARRRRLRDYLDWVLRAD